MSAVSVPVMAPARAAQLQVRVYETLDNLPISHQELFKQNAQRTFFLSLEWFQLLADSALAPNERPRIIVVETAEGSPLLALPVRVQSDGSGKRELFSLSTYYSSYFSLIKSEQSDQLAAALKELAHHIYSETPTWDSLRISPMAQHESEFRELSSSLAEAGMSVQEYFCFGNWYSPVDGRSYADYLQALPSITRNTLTRKSKKLIKSGRARIEVVAGGERLEGAIAAYNQVYASSWKVPEPYPTFVPNLIRLCASKGWLRLGLVFVDDKPAAAQIWIVSNGTAAIYKLAYDEAFADLSAGTVLTATLMEHVIDQDKVTEVDYLTGDDPYKKQWMTHRRERWGIIAFNPRTVRGCVGIARHIGGHLLKRNISNLSSIWQRNKEA